MRKMMAAKKMAKVLSCLVVIAILISAVTVVSAEPASTASVYVTRFTADDDLNIKVINVDASKFQAYFAYKSRTSMNPLADPLVKAGNTHNINSIFLMALAAYESKWGTSNYANTRCNYFGYGALKSNPDNAWEFNSADECVDVVSRFIKCDYLLNSGTYSVLWPAGQVYNPGTKQDHKAPPYIEQTRNAGKYSNGPTLRGWIIKYNLNSQSEMNGILSIMNDFVSWHVRTYGVGLEANGDEDQSASQGPVQSTLNYNRQAAVNYAINYAYRACDCGKYYGSSGPPQGSGTPLGSDGDCAHFVSHCLVAGGLSNKGWCKEGYADGQECKRGARGWCEGGARDYIITAHEMRDWFSDTGIATKVPTVDQLEPGDVITYGSPSSHAVLYIGDYKGKPHRVASHSAWGIFSYTYFGTSREYWHITVGSLPPGHSSLPQDHSLVRCTDDPKVYWLQNGKLYWVTDWSVINDMSTLLGWSTVNVFSSDVFNPDNYQGGPRFITTSSESNGLLIQKSGKATFYFIKDGKRNPFSSWEAFAQRKYDPADVIVVTDAILNRFGIGAWINQEPFTIDMFVNKATFTTGETKQTKVTQTSGRFCTVKTYYQVTKPDGTKRYAYYPNPYFQPTDPLSFSDAKRPLYEDKWISELKTWHFDTYTFTGNEPEGQWSWELWYENANNPGVKIASDTVTYTFTRSSQEQNADLNCDGRVDSSDSGILMSYWGTDGSGATSCRPPDINQDGIVDYLDLSILKSQWTQPNKAPVARITMKSGSETVYEDEVLGLTVPSGGTATVHFSASRSSDPDGTISSYQWLINGQPAGNKCDFDSDDLSEGTYAILLTVTDNEGAEDSVGASIIITSEITAENEPPIARITMASGSETAYEDEVLELTVPSGGTANVHFSASRSTDPDGLISSYQWLINGQPAGNKCDSDSDDLSEGTYDIFLTVIDNEGAEDSVGASIIITATVENEPPTAGITMTSGSETAYENQVLELTVPSGGTAKIYFYADRSFDPDGSISSYKWYIGGSCVSSSRDFSYNLGEGTCDIFLTVKDNKGAEGSVGATVKIIANNPPIARITMKSGSKTAYENQVLELTVPSGGTAKVDFSASRSTDPGGSISSYKWYIGGSFVSSSRDFSYNLGEGTCDIFLTVKDNKGAEGSVGATIKITATNNPPTARITMKSGSKTAYENQVLELTVPSGGTAKVDFSASRSSDPDGSILSYKWYIGGSFVSSSRDFSYNLGEGTCDIFLTVKDNKGAEGSVGATVRITATNEPPTAGLSMSSGFETAYEDEVLALSVPSGGTAEVDFSASRSTDHDGSISSYKWYISGSHVSSSRDFSYNLGEGTHEIYLTVTDNKGAERSVGATVKITATNNPPTARITMQSGSKTAYENQVLELTVPSGGTAKVDFSASRSTDPGGSISSYKWYIGGSFVSSSRDFSYNLGEGTCDIFLTVTDNKGAEGSVGATVKITATNNPPTARITMKSGSKTAYENQVLELTVPSGGTAKVDFSASRSTDPGGSISSYKWYIGGSFVSSSRDFSYNLGEGTCDIFLTVTDNKGAEGSVGATVKITATNNPPTARITMKSGSKTAYENQVLELTVPTGGAAKIDFSASRSSDPDGLITDYQWYIGGSPVKDVRDFYYYLGEGTHDIFLTVKDNNDATGSVGATVKITR